jgi:hypothetical protein
MKTSVVAVATVSILSLVLLASPASSQQQSCGQMSNQSISVSGIIDYITTNASLEVTYYLRSEGRPCISDAFTIVDPRGPARCREGLKITASGILQITATGARITTSNYSCQ